MTEVTDTLKHVMLDIETFDNVPTSAIVQLSAVVFDPYSDRLGEEFNCYISLESSLQKGCTISESTLMWWMNQSEAARSTLIKGIKGGKPLDHALDEFSSFFRRTESVYIWGNGAAFDVAILRHAYSAAGLETPWKYIGERCYRTIANLAPEIKLQDFTGVKHNGLDDARAQAKLIQHVRNTLNLSL